MNSQSILTETEFCSYFFRTTTPQSLQGPTLSVWSSWIGFLIIELGLISQYLILMSQGLSKTSTIKSM